MTDSPPTQTTGLFTIRPRTGDHDKLADQTSAAESAQSPVDTLENWGGLPNLADALREMDPATRDAILELAKTIRPEVRTIRYTAEQIAMADAWLAAGQARFPNQSPMQLSLNGPPPAPFPPSDTKDRVLGLFPPHLRADPVVQERIGKVMQQVSLQNYLLANGIDPTTKQMVNPVGVYGRNNGEAIMDSSSHAQGTQKKKPINRRNAEEEMALRIVAAVLAAEELQQLSKLEEVVSHVVQAMRAMTSSAFGLRRP